MNCIVFHYYFHDFFTLSRCYLNCKTMISKKNIKYPLKMSEKFFWTATTSYVHLCLCKNKKSELLEKIEMRERRGINLSFFLSLEGIYTKYNFSTTNGNNKQKFFFVQTLFWFVNWNEWWQDCQQCIILMVFLRNHLHTLLFAYQTLNMQKERCDII